MDKIVYRDGYACKAVQDGWRVKVWGTLRRSTENGSKGHYVPSAGQREVTITPRKVYVRLDEERAPFDCVDRVTGKELEIDTDLDELEKRVENARKRAQSRAKVQCRRKIKEAGFTSMLTGTYRENMKDFDRMRRDFAAWLRIMRREIPGFRCTYAFEPQERGAWHFHAAIDRLAPFYQRRGVKLKSYDLARRAWRRVVGENNGNIDVDGHRGRGKQHADQRKQSLARLAGYISKYLTKDHADSALFGRNMWGSTQGLSVSPPLVIELEQCPILDAIVCAFEVLPGHRVASHGLSRSGEAWWLFTEPDT